MITELAGDKGVHEINYSLLMYYEHNGFIPKCSFCENIISESVDEFFLMMNHGKPIAVAVQLDDDKAEFYCKKCYDKLLC